MGKALLLFLLIVLAGANVALYRHGRERPAPPPIDAGAVESAPSSATTREAVQGARTSTAPATTTAAPPSAATTTTQPPVRPVASQSALLLPVQGVTPSQLQDTFSQARAQGRVHEAIDIMAPRGAPVLAVADGHVEKLFASVPGGLTIYQFEPGGRYAYYYAHLDRYADGLAEQKPVHRGDVIGYVGSTGNADPSAPHLHFAIFELGPERQWWKGTAINPYPILTQAR